MSSNRRDFLKTAAGAAGALGLSTSAWAALPAPQSSGLDRIVVVMMENRSFDHFLGWLPGADGKQAGLTYTDRTGAAVPTYALAPDYTGCGHPDPTHGYNDSRVAWDNGAMDGFLRAGSNDRYAAGYYVESDLPFLSALARNYVVCDRYFVSILGPTFPNRMFLWSAQTDRLGDTVSLSSLPTIFDRLAAARVSHRYYFNNLPYLAFWGLKYLFSTGTFSEFLSSAAAGTLPAVSFVDPNYTLLDDGSGNDDHPHADVRNGDAFLSRIYHALTNNAAAWSRTALIVTFDEWGGFFEHIAPPRAVAPNTVDPDLVNGQALLGFRVPVIVASPFTRNTGPAPLVSHDLYDHTSILKLIEWRWNLQPLTARDASPQIGNLAQTMSFGTPLAAATLPTPAAVSAPACFGGSIFNSGSALTRLESSAAGQSPWMAFAQSDSVQRWLNHPRFHGRAPAQQGITGSDTPCSWRVRSVYRICREI